MKYTQEQQRHMDNGTTFEPQYTPEQAREEIYKLRGEIEYVKRDRLEAWVRNDRKTYDRLTDTIYELNQRIHAIEESYT